MLAHTDRRTKGFSTVFLSKNSLVYSMSDSLSQLADKMSHRALLFLIGVMTLNSPTAFSHLAMALDSSGTPLRSAGRYICGLLGPKKCPGGRKFHTGTSVALTGSLRIFDLAPHFHLSHGFLVSSGWSISKYSKAVHAA